MKLGARFILLICCWFSTAVFAQTFGAQTKVRLLLAAESAQPGETVLAGVQMKMPPNWHTYWKNSGKFGSPTEINWSLPEGVTANDIQWPTPEKNITPAGDELIISYVYHDETIFLVPITLSSNNSICEK
jgi:thiol:disulfide interchange protein DsbD